MIVGEVADVGWVWGAGEGRVTQADGTISVISPDDGLLEQFVGLAHANVRPFFLYFFVSRVIEY